MAKMTPIRFFRQVRQEMSKVTWPTRQETTMTTVMVLVMASLFAVFFLLIDQAFSHIIPWILGIGA
jgi:preprotein translocase subunit SecE